MKKFKSKSYSNHKGVTLIVLVVTIVVLLILAGVSISVLSGDDGIIKKAQESQNKSEEGVQKDKERVKTLGDWLNSKTKTKSNDLTFKIVGKTYKIEKDMTWAQWIESKYNTDKYRIEGNSTNGVVLKNDSIDTIKYCPKATQIALAKDTIITGQNYTLSTIKLPIYWYLSEAGEYVSVTDESELETVLLNNRAQLAHCPDVTSSNASNWNYDHIGNTGVHSHLIYHINLVNGSIQSDENLILTQQIAIPYYKCGEEIQELNGENSTVTIQELLTKMGIDTSNKITTNNGSYIDINECEMILPFFEIYLTNAQNDRKYDLSKKLGISMTFETLRDFEKESILVLYIEANSNNVSIAKPQDFEPETGDITLELSKLGAITILYGTPEEE